MDSVVTIWLLLLLAAVVALAGLALPRDVRRPRQISAWLAGHAARKAEEAERRAAEAAESIRYAEEVAVAAAGAASTAERRRVECQEAQARVDRTWQAYQDADAALTRARKAAVYAAWTRSTTPSGRGRCAGARRPRTAGVICPTSNCSTR